MSTLSTHVLDAERGKPAAGMPLIFMGPDGMTQNGVTDADGRFRVEGPVPPGTHSVQFETGPWFAAQERDTFYPEIRVSFTVAEGEHYHVAVLLSPFAFTTYRGS